MKKSMLIYRKLGLFDISFVFNLVQEMAVEGEVTPLYLQVPYQIGLAMQLFGILIFGGIKLPDGVRYRANLQIIWQGGQRTGFWMEREIYPGAFDRERELYLFWLRPSATQGSDRAALEYILDQLPAECKLHADCFPQSYTMRRLLQVNGFQAKPKNQQLQGKLHSYLFIKPSKETHRTPLSWIN